MIRNSLLPGLACALALSVSASLAQERVDRTGSRLGSDSTPRSVYHFEPPGEVRRVRALIARGETGAAVELARDYLESLDSSVSTGNMPAALRRYYGLNALCAALTKHGEVEAAVEACSEAVDLYPSRWMALNSRGSAYFARRDFGQALVDYRRALELAPDNEGVVAMLEHNIGLAEQRIAASNGGR